MFEIKSIFDNVLKNIPVTKQELLEKIKKNLACQRIKILLYFHLKK